MRSTTALILATLASAGICRAQAKPQHSVEIKVLSARNSCVVANAEIPCSAVGSKLRSLNVPMDADIHVTGDEQVRIELTRSVFDSLAKAGYRTKIAIITG
jgi:biopolymer transport protein ExbD